MAMIDVVAKEKIYYGGRDRHPGEVFQMDDRQEIDINIMTVLGKIEKVKSAAPYRDKAMRPAPPPAKEEAPPEVPPQASQEPPPDPPKVMTTEGNPLTGSESPASKRFYRRRDMRSDR
jgi:hypothetical protein